MMAIKDLLVAFDGNAASHTAARLGVQMAQKYGARLTGVFVAEPASYGSHLQRWMTRDVQAQVREAEKVAAAGIEEQFRKAVADAGYAAAPGWIQLEGKPYVLLPRISRYFDLMLVGEFGSDERAAGRELQADSLLLRSGKPLIVVPKSYTVRPFREHAMVAWDGSRSAARALTDAMQILETKQRLDVIDLKRDRSRWEPPAADHDIVAHLKLHGVNAERVTLDPGTRLPGQALLDHAGETDPDLLVMGAYGRGKFGGLLFGSMTRYVLENLTVPALLSH